MARFALLLILVGLIPRQLDYNQQIAWNLPDPVRHKLESSKFLEHFTLSDAINPFYLRGDFNGDGKIDYAVLVAAKTTAKRYIVICRSGTSNLEILTGRDKSTIFDPNQPTPSKDNVDWMDAWQITDKLKLETNELNEGAPQPMRGEGYYG